MSLLETFEERPEVKMEDHTEEQSDEEGSSPSATSPEMDDDAGFPSTSNLSPVAAAPTSPTSSTSPGTSPTSPTSTASSSMDLSSSSLHASHFGTSRPNSKLATTRPSPHYTRPTSPAPPIQPRLRTRGLGLTPLSSTNNTCHPLAPLGTGNLPKSQPLARALFAKMANGHVDTPHAGMGGKKKVGGQKLIVPTKGFKTRFELSLSASELARE